MGEGSSGLPALLTGVVSSLFGVMGDVADTVSDNALMLIGIAAVVGGIGIAWFKSLTGQRRRGRK